MRCRQRCEDAARARARSPVVVNRCQGGRRDLLVAVTRAGQLSAMEVFLQLLLSRGVVPAAAVSWRDAAAPRRPAAAGSGDALASLPQAARVKSCGARALTRISGAVSLQRWRLHMPHAPRRSAWSPRGTCRQPPRRLGALTGITAAAAVASVRRRGSRCASRRTRVSVLPRLSGRAPAGRRRLSSAFLRTSGDAALMCSSPPTWLLSRRKYCREGRCLRGVLRRVRSSSAVSTALVGAAALSKPG